MSNPFEIPVGDEQMAGWDDNEDDYVDCSICNNPTLYFSMVFEMLPMPMTNHPNVHVMSLVCTDCYSERHYGHPPKQTQSASVVEHDGTVGTDGTDVEESPA